MSAVAKVLPTDYSKSVLTYKAHDDAFTCALFNLLFSHDFCFLDDDTMMMHGRNLPVLFVSARTSLYFVLTYASGVCAQTDACNYASRARRAISRNSLSHTLSLPCSEYFRPAFTSGYNSPMLFDFAPVQRVYHVPDSCGHKICWQRTFEAL